MLNTNRGDISLLLSNLLILWGILFFNETVNWISNAAAYLSGTLSLATRNLKIHLTRCFTAFSMILTPHDIIVRELRNLWLSKTLATARMLLGDFM